MGDWQFAKKPIELPFSMGLELELQMITKEGLFLSGDEMVFHMKQMVENSHEILSKSLDDGTIPKFIARKIRDEPHITQNEEKGTVLSLNYEINGRGVDIEIFGRDGNVASITYILEVVTPPCTTLDELVWWCQRLTALAELVMPKELFVISTGFCPLQREYYRGLSFGTHFHLGNFKDEKEKYKVYNMLRNFLPHIVALTVNSPFINGTPTDDVRVIQNRYAAPGCLRSVRLKSNVSMLSRSDPRVYIPYLYPEHDSNYFLNVIEKASLEDARFQDIFPFTEWGTIELRICDAQLSLARTIGMALTIQAIGLLARSMKTIPDVGSKTIVTNRESAITRGLFGTFRAAEAPFREMMQSNPTFTELYLGDFKKNKLHTYIFESVQKMFVLLKGIFKKTRFLETPFLNPLLLSVFGDVDIAQFPFSEAEYQLYLYLQKQKDIYAVLKDLIILTAKCCENPTYSPISGKLNKW
ncbi:MAG: glutamate-cysteine ligase family protein [Candidatus Helarchaeota archaeon]